METQILDYINPSLLLDQNAAQTGEIAWKSPSNIALVKYWGKHGKQLPRNPSLSLTLDKAATYTSLKYQPRKSEGGKSTINLQFSFEGLQGHPFGGKVKAFLESLLPVFPFLRQLDLSIESRNTFPHSSGIASSASSMSALALALCDLEHELFGIIGRGEDFLRKASFIARLGSGSASRSIYQIAALWGKWKKLPSSSDNFAIPCEDVFHPVFSTFQDAILIVDKGSKAVSSRAGHSLMEGNPYAAARYEQAEHRLDILWEAMKAGDLDTFGQICEAEALTLHALMMTSTPPYMLLRPETLKIIRKVQTYRGQENVPVYVTLDAGPNVHLLFPIAHKEAVTGFIDQELAKHCQNGHWLADKVGKGPEKLA